MANDAGLEVIAKSEEFGEVGLFHTGEGNACPFGDDVFHIFFPDIDNDFVPFFMPSIEIGFELGGGFFFAIAEGGSAFKILGFDSGFFFGANGFDFCGGGFKFGRA